ncbi:SGNH/GDSL hydrolase family protein [Nocardioides ferulae]|uniref:SGNH/GDSL hydrolase family protein n=1 Tax=Nocardioides ferulae TaxID=2340821 RepID=UPI000EAFE1AC|nr:SGNH/GDSL hydrolase family protein [Nocardioides ferulae]
MIATRTARSSRPLLRSLATGLVGLLAAVLGAAAVPATATAPASSAAAKEAPDRPRYREYVALGDSWTAGVVLVNADGLPDTRHAPIDCGQSLRSYPKLVAAELGVKRFRDASCGSATTDDFAAPQTELPIGGTNPPQFDRLTRRTDLVTVGIGGNDAGISSAGMDCLNLLPVENPISDTGPGLPLGGCKAKYTAGGVDQLSVQIAESEPKVVRALKAIHRISPRARVLLVNYLAAVPDHACYPRVPATDEDMAYIAAKFRELNAMLRRAARKGGAELVDTYRPTIGHDLCQGPTVRYAEVLGLSVNDPAVGIPAHPNAAGARAQAAIVLEAIRG